MTSAKRSSVSSLTPRDFRYEMTPCSALAREATELWSLPFGVATSYRQSWPCGQTRTCAFIAKTIVDSCICGSSARTIVRVQPATILSVWRFLFLGYVSIGNLRVRFNWKSSSTFQLRRVPASGQLCFAGTFLLCVFGGDSLLEGVFPNIALRFRGSGRRSPGFVRQLVRRIGGLPFPWCL